MVSGFRHGSEADHDAPIFHGLAVGIVVGVVVGVVVSRMYRLDWDHNAAQVVSHRQDRDGRARALPPVRARSIDGVMLGRIVGMAHGIRGVLRDAGVHVPSTEGDRPTDS